MRKFVSVFKGLISNEMLHSHREREYHTDTHVSEVSRLVLRQGLGCRILSALRYDPGADAIQSDR